MRLIVPALLILSIISTASATQPFRPEIPVAPPALEPAGGSAPRMATDGVDFLVAWAFGRAQNGVYATRVSASGDVLDPTGIRLGDISPYLTFIPITVLYVGGNYAVMWFNSDTIMFASVDRDGRIITPAKALAKVTHAYGSHYAATDGSRIIVAYITPEPRFMIVTGDGDVIRDAPIPTRPPNNYNFTAASNGSEFMIAWNESTRGSLIGIDGVRIARDGTVLDQPKPLLPGQTSGYDPLIVSDGTDFLLLYRSSGNTMAERIGSALEIGGSVLSVTTDEIVWHGSQYLALTSSGGTSPAVVALDRDGRPQGEGKPITAGAAMAIAAGQALIAWIDRQGIGRERITDTTNFAPTPDHALTYAARPQKTPSLAFSGRTYLAAWNEHDSLLAGRISTDGQPLDGLGIRLTDRQAGAAALLFNGAKYVIAWNEQPNVLRVNTMADDGIVADAASLQGCGSGPSLTNGPRGETLLLSGPCAWRLDAAGHAIDSIRLQFAPSGRDFSAAWNGGEYLVAWRDPVWDTTSQFPRYIVRGARLTDSLAPIDIVPIDIAAARSDWTTEPSVASDGNEFVIAFENIDFAAHVRHVSGSGAVLDDLNLGPTSSSPLVMWDGTRYFVSFHSYGVAIGAYAGSSHEPLPIEREPIAINVESLARPVRVYDGAVAVAYSRVAPEPAYAGADRVFIRTMLPPSRRRTLRPQSLANGWWTGTSGIALLVQPNGVVSVGGGGCISGSFPKPQIIAGAFTAEGKFGVEFGPTPPMWSLPPATFRGSVEGSRLRLTVDQANGVHRGPWILEFDGPETRHPVGGPCP